VGTVDEKYKKLVRVAWECLDLAIKEGAYWEIINYTPPTQTKIFGRCKGITPARLALPISCSLNPSLMHESILMKFAHLQYTT